MTAHNSHKVLVLEGATSAGQGLAARLGSGDLRISTEATLQEALRCLRASDIHLILLDADTFPGSGSDNLKALKEVAGPVPVLVCTRGRDEPSIGLLFEAGANDLVNQPCTDLELRMRVASQLRLHETLQELSRKEQDAQLMLELTSALSSSLDFPDILQTVVRHIAGAVDVDGASIILLADPINPRLAFVVASDDPTEPAHTPMDLRGHPDIQRALQTQKPQTVSHPATGQESERSGTQEPTVFIIPIVWEETAVGVLVLRSRSQRETLTERELHLSSIAANATGAALRNARVLQSLRDHTQQVTFAHFEAERRLRSLKKYADLFAAAADGIAVFDSKARLVFANPRACDLFGKSEAEMRGQRVLDVLVNEDQQLARDAWAKATAGGVPREIDLRIARVDQSPLICSCSFASAGEAKQGVIVSFRDVTEQRRTEQELVKTKDFLESLINASIDGVMATAMDGTVLVFNKSAERILGYTAQNAMHALNMRQLYSPEDFEEIQRRLKAAGEDEDSKLEDVRVEARNAAGEPVPISLSSTFIYEAGEPVAMVGIFRDLRDKLRVEERLAKAQEALAMSEKQALIAELAGTAAHELNQPLTSVLGYAELLKRRLAQESPERRAADTIIDEAERMADIVRKIGRITKYETTSYVGQQKIIDLEKSSSDSLRPPAK